MLIVCVPTRQLMISVPLGLSLKKRERKKDFKMHVASGIFYNTTQYITMLNHENSNAARLNLCPKSNCSALLIFFFNLFKVDSFDTL